MEPSPSKELMWQFTQNVVADVINGVKQQFTVEGIDEEVIKELRQTWEAKLLASKTLDAPASDSIKNSKDGNKMVSVQIVLGNTQVRGSGNKMVVVQVPASAVENKQIHNVLMGPVVSATMNLPQPLATSVLQQHMNAVFRSQQEVKNLINKPTLTGANSNKTMEYRKDEPSTAGLSNSNKNHARKNYKVTKINGSSICCKDKPQTSYGSNNIRK